MNYQEAERQILSFTDYEKTPGVLYTSTTYDLARMECLLQGLGNPHMAARSAHVAGTKGKGSTTAMIASALARAGYRTGLYTSPHFHTLRERIRVDGTMISEEAFAKVTDRLLPIVGAVNAESASGQLTTFEILTVLAFTYFAQCGVQYQALEVGLGGRLDATNVVKPDVCVITSISLDHTEVLGTTLEAIAAEKAGIIKQGSTVVVAPQVDAVDAVIARICQEKGAYLIRVGRDIVWEAGESSFGRQRCRVSGRTAEYNLDLPLLGEHQIENAACAIGALEVLVEKGGRLSTEDIVQGLAAVDWPGRLQVLRSEPWLVCDGAHNVDSAAKLCHALKRLFPFRDATLVMGTSSDKDIAGMVATLAPLFKTVVVTKSKHPRSAPVEALAREFYKHGITVVTAETAAEAVEHALSAAKPSDLVCVTGSLFVVGEVLAWAGHISQ